MIGLGELLSKFFGFAIALINIAHCPIFFFATASLPLLSLLRAVAQLSPPFLLNCVKIETTVRRCV